MARESERQVKIAGPDGVGEATIVVTSAPVYFDLGWKPVDGEDYGDYGPQGPVAQVADPNAAAQLAAQQRAEAEAQRRKASNPQ